MIGANDSGTLLSLRERAVITLLAHLGLRAGEVIRLKLDDIDWLEGHLIIRSGKNHRERSLPLSAYGPIANRDRMRVCKYRQRA
jgi:integrase/recombinase XerD